MESRELRSESLLNQETNLIHGSESRTVFSKLVGDLKERTLIIGDDDFDSARTGRLVAQEKRIVKHSQTEADKAAAKPKSKPTSSPISHPLRQVFQSKKEIVLTLNPTDVDNDAHASVRVALHVSRCGERRLHHRGPRRFPVQGLCTCPLRNTFDICPQQNAFEIVDVLATRVALGRFYFVLCFMKGTQLQSIDFRGFLRVELRNNVLSWRSLLHTST